MCYSVLQCVWGGGGAYVCVSRYNVRSNVAGKEGEVSDNAFPSCGLSVGHSSGGSGASKGVLPLHVLSVQVLGGERRHHHTPTAPTGQAT